MFQKEYNLKIYSLAGVFVKTIPFKELMNDVSYTETINAGQGEMRLQLSLEWTSTFIAYNQIIKVYESDKDHSTARCIYTGIVGNLRRVIERGKSFIEVRAVGIGSMLTFMYFKYGWSYTPTRNQSAELTMKEVADYFTTLYPGLLTYSGATIETATASNLVFDFNKCLEALGMIAESVNSWWWSIDGEAKLQFHPISGSPYKVTHLVTLEKQVESIVVDENVEKLVNNYLLYYTGGDTSASDGTSQTANGLRELKETKTEINDGTTATNSANSYIAQNKDYKRRITVVVNDQYDIESIHAGHFITINNTDFGIVSLQIQKLQYNINNVELELEYITSFGKEIYS